MAWYRLVQLWIYPSVDSAYSNRYNDYDKSDSDNDDDINGDGGSGCDGIGDDESDDDNGDDHITARTTSTIIMITTLIITVSQITEYT